MRRFAKILLFLLALIALQQLISTISHILLKEQRQIIETRDLDPAVFFYTESDEALRAEKQVRQSISEQ